MTITADDLGDEFTDFKGQRPLKTDIQYLLFLLKHRVLVVQKRSFPDNFQYSFKDLLFDWFPIYKHFESRQYRDKTAFALFKVNRFIKSLKDGWKVGPEISYYGQGGYRSDIGVLVPGSNDYHITLAVEVGNTDWTKIKECLLGLPHLKEIWHFPDYSDYFIWRRGKNANLLSQIEVRNKDWLGKLTEEAKAESTRRKSWYQV